MDFLPYWILEYSIQNNLCNIYELVQKTYSISSCLQDSSGLDSNTSAHLFGFKIILVGESMESQWNYIVVVTHFVNSAWCTMVWERECTHSRVRDYCALYYTRSHTTTTISKNRPIFCSCMFRMNFSRNSTVSASQLQFAQDKINNPFYVT